MEKIDISGEWRVTLEKADTAGCAKANDCSRQAECTERGSPNSADSSLIHVPGCTAA